MDSIGNFLSSNSGAIGSALGTGAQLYGQQNAAEAIESANQGAITNQQNYLGNISGLYSPYTTAGAGATSALASAEGLNGQPANYSGFENMPGYQFAVQQGQQAAERQAAAMGNAGNSGTAMQIGNQVTGTAMQDYNTYIGQLQATAGMGATATGQLGNLTYNTGANTSQLMSNTGMAQAGMYTGMGQTLGSALGANGTGVAGSLGSAAVGGIGNILGGSGTGSNGLTNNGAGGQAGTGAPIYTTNTASAASANQGLTNAQNNPSNFDTSGSNGSGLQSIYSGTPYYAGGGSSTSGSIPSYASSYTNELW
jgi:hypothetical protein